MAPGSGGAALTGVFGIETSSMTRTTENAITLSHLLLKRFFLMYPLQTNFSEMNNLIPALARHRMDLLNVNSTKSWTSTLSTIERECPSPGLELGHVLSTT